MLAFFLSQLLIEPYSLLRCSLVFFFLVFISFLFLLLLLSSALPYYAITECFSSPAPHISCVLWMLGHLEAGILAHSLFSTSHLSFKKKTNPLFLENSHLHFPSEKDIGIPVSAPRANSCCPHWRVWLGSRPGSALLEGICCWEHPTHQATPEDTKGLQLSGETEASNSCCQAAP